MAETETDRSSSEWLPSQAAVRDSLRLIHIRWVAGALLPLTTVFCVHLLGLPLPELQLIALGAAILLYNIALNHLVQKAAAPQARSAARRVQQVVILQVVLDWLSLGIFLHLTGGVVSPAIPFLLLHMLSVAILLPRRSPYLYVGLGTSVLLLVTWLEWAGVLPHYRIIPSLPPGLYRDPVYVAARLTFFTVTALVLVYLTRSITQRLRRRERHLSALLQTAQAVSSSLDLPEVLDALARQAAHALSMPKASIRLLDETGDRLAMTAAFGLSSSYLDKGPVEVSRSPLDAEALAGQPVIVREAATDPRIQYPKEVAAEGIRSILVVPIMGERRPLGVLRVYSDQPDCFTPEDAEFVTAIARQGAIAIENALAHQALREADRRRAEFMRVVTHELRSPVAGAQSLLRTLLRGLAGELTAPQRDILSRLARRLDALMALIDDLLVLAASKTVELEEPLRRLPLQPVIRQVVEALAHRAEEKQITLTVDLPPEALPIRGTEEGLARIFSNLLDNAIKYTPSGGHVCIKAAERGGQAVITVTDSGIGIPEDELPHIWDEFFRSRRVRREGIRGTGLGLSIVRQNVERFGGTIGVRSVEGEGTTFRITFPIAGPGDIEEEAESL